MFKRIVSVLLVFLICPVIVIAFRVAKNNLELVECCEWILLAIKPVFFKEVLSLTASHNIYNISVHYITRRYEKAHCQRLMLLRMLVQQKPRQYKVITIHQSV